MEQYDNGISMIMNAARNYPLLTKKQEFELAYKIKQGDQESLNTLVMSNIRLAVKIASRHQSLNSMQFSDVVQEGIIGLMRAAKGFDPDKGWRFSTYATWWVMQSIQRAIQNRESAVRIPVHAQSHARQFQRRKEELRQLIGQEPDVEEVAADIGWSNKQLEQVITWGRVDRSLDDSFEQDGRELHETIPDINADVNKYFEQAELKKSLAAAIETLDPRSSEIIKLRNGLNNVKSLSLRETSSVIGLSPERIRQIEKKALKTLSKNQNLKLWLEV